MTEDAINGFSLNPGLIGHVEGRRFEPHEIARIFRVHPSQIGETERSRQFSREEIADLIAKLGTLEKP